MQKIEVMLGRKSRKSTVSYANSVSKSLRTTVPTEIVENLSLEVGDVLDWELVTHNNKKAVKVRKLE